MPNKKSSVGAGHLGSLSNLSSEQEYNRVSSPRELFSLEPKSKHWLPLPDLCRNLQIAPLSEIRAGGGPQVPRTTKTPVAYGQRLLTPFALGGASSSVRSPIYAG